MVEEYSSFPTTTLYEMHDVERVSPPAFTICPKPSVNSTFASRKKLEFKISQSASFSLGDLVWYDDSVVKKLQNISTANGETIINISDGGI